MPQTRKFRQSLWMEMNTKRFKAFHRPQVKIKLPKFFMLCLSTNSGFNYHSGFVYSGMGPDFRVLVSSARKEAQKYFLTYREVQPVSQVAKESALLMQEYTQSGGVRPFGVSCLVAGFDHDGPQLFQVDPSGAAFGWKATAIGKNYINAKNFLERRYNDDLELDDAIHIALLTLRESYEGEMTEFNIEVGIVGADRVFRILTPQEVRDYLDEAN